MNIITCNFQRMRLYKHITYYVVNCNKSFLAFTLTISSDKALNEFQSPIWTSSIIIFSLRMSLLLTIPIDFSLKFNFWLVKDVRVQNWLQRSRHKRGQCLHELIASWGHPFANFGADASFQGHSSALLLRWIISDADCRGPTGYDSQWTAPYVPL